MSAERLVKDDVLWGVVNGGAGGKSWATLEETGQPVLAIRRWDGRRLDVRVKTPEGESNLAFVHDDQVLIEHRAHPNAV
jgi:hypothetical protein